jgi:hypothetical protein
MEVSISLGTVMVVIGYGSFGGGNRSIQRNTDLSHNEIDGFSYIVPVSFIGGGNRSIQRNTDLSHNEIDGFSYIVPVSFIGGDRHGRDRIW